MKSIFPILACLAAVSCGPTAQAQSTDAASSASGETLVDRVVAAVDAQPSISAKVRHRVDLTGRALIGTGIYLQQGRGAGRTFRLELQLRTRLYASGVRHVCDGTNLWLFEELDGNKNLTVVDMTRLHGARPKSPGAAPPASALSALGGLPKLLGGLQEAFVFGNIVESRLDELRVWTTEGEWSPARLIQLLPEQQEAVAAGRGANLSKLAANLPHRVVLHIGCDDLFPYRIEYWRTEPDDNVKQASGRKRLMVVMELYEVQLGAPIDPGQFAFAPGGVAPVDRTKEFLDRLGLEDPLPEEAKRRLRSPL